MPLDADQGKQLLQLITSRYNDWRWRKKIEKTLGLPPSGLKDGKQRALFLYLKNSLRAYKSRRSDPDSWIVGGFVTQEVIERARFNPKVVGPEFAADDVGYLGTDPGPGISDDWWEEALVLWHQEKEELEAFEAEVEAREREAADARAGAGAESKGPAEPHEKSEASQAEPEESKPRPR